jgi:membrane fusion protein (multidrug efflux system)
VDTPPTAFSRTFTRLHADRSRATAGAIACGGLVLVLWWWWASQVQVTLYELSTSARVELDASTYPIQSPRPGRIVAASLRVGQVVRRGDVLVELDAAADELHRRQEQVRAQGIEPALQRLRSEVAAEERARAEERRSADLRADEAASRLREAHAEAEYVEGELVRVERLHQHQLVPQRDLERARTDAERRRAVVRTLEGATSRVLQEQATRDRERDVRIERLGSRIAGLDAERRTLWAGIERLTHEIERYRIRAPIDGTVAESAVLRVGAVVDAGERIASVISTAALVVAAQFPPQAAFGRIRPGLPATLRLEGFPWTEFGAVSATVTRVAQEIRDNGVRVELAIDPHSAFRVPLEHGMPGALEIAVERQTPLALVLRAAGQSLTGRR